MVKRTRGLMNYDEKYDMDKDGEISDSELDHASTLLELELREEKADTQRRMAWGAMISMLIFTILLFTPVVTDARVQALADLLGLFYIAQAGIVGAYMGVTAWMSNSASSSRSERDGYYRSGGRYGRTSSRSVVAPDPD
jgi:hypothetical protein